MRILIIHASSYGYWIFLGIADLSAYLKREGHETTLYDTTHKELDFIKQDIHSKIDEYKPDLIAVSCLSADYPKALEIAREIKSMHDIKIIFGGVHPTVDPLGTISNEHVDMVCVGEGELAMAELASKMERGGDYSSVQNIWIKKNGKVITSPVRPLIANLDDLPYPDRQLFDSQHVIMDNGRVNTIPVAAGRGCPYSCPYCINSILRDMYVNKGRLARLKSANRLIDEIKDILATYKPDRVQIAFQDDTFTMSKKWLKEFCEVYSKEIGLPFTCLTRVDNMSPEIAQMLKNAGCEAVFMAIEAGNPHLRIDVLQRNHSDEQIINAFKVARKAGLMTISLTMLGIPYETEDTLRDSINLNKKANPDKKNVGIFQPYHGTALRNVCIKEGFFTDSDDAASGIHNSSHLKLPRLSKYVLEKTHDLFTLYVEYSPRYYVLFDSFYFVLHRLNQREKIKKLIYLSDLYREIGVRSMLYLALKRALKPFKFSQPQKQASHT